MSRRLGVRPERDVFLFDTGTMALPYAEALDAIVVYSVKDGVLRLLDVVAPRMPSLDEVCASIPEPYERVALYFAPDGLGAGDLEAEPYRLDDFLMVRGPWPVDGPFMLPPTARC